MTHKLLEVKNLSVSYGNTHVIENISFSLNAGEFLGITGPSGAGKSTLLHSLGGLLPKTTTFTGKIYFYQNSVVTDITNNPQGLRALQGSSLTWLPQDAVASLYPNATIAEQFGYILNSKPHDVLPATEALLQSLGLEDAERLLASYPFELSGGQCQRLALAMAVVKQPLLLLADEPTSGLDVESQDELAHVLKSLQKTGLALIIISHNIKFLEKLCDRVLYIQKGSLEMS